MREEDNCGFYFICVVVIILGLFLEWAIPTSDYNTRQRIYRMEQELEKQNKPR